MPINKSHSDSQLLELLQQGNEVAFAEVFDRYWDVLYVHVLKMLKDEDEAKDVVQDLFSALWANSAKIQSNTNLSGYLYVSARNRVLNLIRQSKVKAGYLSSLAQFLEEASTETLDRLDERELSLVIEKEIALLPPKMKEVFELSRKSNLSHKEIANQLDISDKTVKKQISNALKIIRGKLKLPIALSMVSLVLFR